MKLNAGRLTRRRFVACAAALALTAPFARAADDTAAASAYPSRTITMLVGFPAGGPSDAAARLLVERLQTKWPKANIIVENRGGANGSLAAAALTKAPADGYTLFLVTRSHVNLNWLYPKLPFNVEKDFQPVALMLTMPNVLVVGPSVKDADYAAFAAHVKAQPNALTAFSSGNGSDPHLALEEFRQKTGLQLRHIPYKGGGPGLIDMLGGNVDASFATLGTVMEQIRQGKARALAVGGDARDPMLPNVPTFKELGVKDYSPQAWYGVMAPAGTPKAIVDKLNTVINEVMNTPEGAKKLEVLGALPVKSSVEDFTRLYHKEIEENGKLIKSLHVTLD
jgi:tripartite-type tricarboxylate transporter receptor subunit TctC